MTIINPRPSSEGLINYTCVPAATISRPMSCKTASLVSLKSPPGSGMSTNCCYNLSPFSFYSSANNSDKWIYSVLAALLKLTL